MLESTLLAPLGHVSWVDLTARLVTLVATDDYLDPGHVDAETTHFLLPVDQRRKAIPIVNIVHHDNPVCILIELLPNQPVVIIATQIKEVNRNRLLLNCQLLNAIIDTNSGNVSFDETTLAVALDQAGLTNFTVAYRGYFETNLVDSRHVSEVA